MVSGLTQEKLKEVLEYDPGTGIFRWKTRMAVTGSSRALKAWNTKNAGKVAGKIGKNGYVYICVEYGLRTAHRLAFIYMTGAAPDFVDHKDTNRANNRWDNLREASPTQNAANSNLRKDNKSGHKGIYWYGHISCWRAVIQRDGKQINLGYFKEKQRAIDAYQTKAKELFGPFARFD